MAGSPSDLPASAHALLVQGAQSPSLPCPQLAPLPVPLSWPAALAAALAPDSSSGDEGSAEHLPSTCHVRRSLGSVVQADAEELGQLREKVKTHKSASSQQAKEAKAMQARALQLSAEVERVKEMLLVRSCTPAWGFDLACLSA